MAITKYGSPGVYINEIDKSYYETPKDRSISITLMGPACQGDVGVPTDVESVSDFINKFGEPFGYAGLCATMCLSQASSVKFIRLADKDEIQSRSVSFDGQYTTVQSVSSALVFTNNEVGGDETTWTMTVTTSETVTNGFNLLFKKGDTVVYNSVTGSANPPATGTDYAKGPFVPGSDDYTNNLTAIATECGFETPTSNAVTLLDAGEYTFTAGSAEVKRSVTISGKLHTLTTVDDVLQITSTAKGTVNNKNWTARILNSAGSNFDLIINNGEGVVYTSVVPDHPGNLSINDIALLEIDGFELDVNLGNATSIPNADKDFTAGSNGWTNDEGDSEPSEAIIECLESVSDRETVSTDIISAPDLTSIGYLKKIVSIAEGASRRDVVAIVDIPEEFTAEQAVAHIAELNSSYGTAYYPWVEVYNQYKNRNEIVPPSLVVLTAMVREYLTYPRWTAPAGQPRLNLTELVSYSTVLTQKSRDVLYTGRINPLCNYKNLGNTAMGQKTLLKPNEQGLESSLNRLNVRFLINYIKTNVEIISASFIFANIEQTTFDSWILEVSKFLDTIKVQGGLYDYKITMNWNTVTADHLNNNIMPGIIQVKPTRVAEYIPIDVVILNRDDEFTE